MAQPQFSERLQPAGAGGGLASRRTAIPGLAAFWFPADRQGGADTLARRALLVTCFVALLGNAAFGLLGIELRPPDYPLRLLPLLIPLVFLVGGTWLIWRGADSGVGGRRFLLAAMWLVVTLIVRFRGAGSSGIAPALGGLGFLVLPHRQAIAFAAVGLLATSTGLLAHEWAAVAAARTGGGSATGTHLFATVIWSALPPLIIGLYMRPAFVARSGGEPAGDVERRERQNWIAILTYVVGALLLLTAVGGLLAPMIHFTWLRVCIRVAWLAVFGLTLFGSWPATRIAIAVACTANFIATGASGAAQPPLVCAEVGAIFLLLPFPVAALALTAGILGVGGLTLAGPNPLPAMSAVAPTAFATLLTAAYAALARQHLTLGVASRTAATPALPDIDGAFLDSPANAAARRPAVVVALAVWIAGGLGTAGYAAMMSRRATGALADEATSASRALEEALGNAVRFLDIAANHVEETLERTGGVSRWVGEVAALSPVMRTIEIVPVVAAPPGRTWDVAVGGDGRVSLVSIKPFVAGGGVMALRGTIDPDLLSNTTSLPHLRTRGIGYRLSREQDGTSDVLLASHPGQPLPAAARSRPVAALGPGWQFSTFYPDDRSKEFEYDLVLPIQFFGILALVAGLATWALLWGRAYGVFLRERAARMLAEEERRREQAEAERAAHAVRIAEMQAEIDALARISPTGAGASPQPAATDRLPLAEREPAVFAEVARTAAALLDLSVGDRHLATDDGDRQIRLGCRELASTLFGLRARPGDVVAVQSTALQSRTAAIPARILEPPGGGPGHLEEQQQALARRVEAYIAENRFQLVRIMGELLDLYRSAAAAAPGEPPRPSRPG